VSDDCKLCSEWGSDHFMYVGDGRDYNVSKEPYIPNPKYASVERCNACKYAPNDPCWGCRLKAGVHEEDDSISCCKETKSNE
jgi:hypothetical protein